jgi:Spy/CpxP family protein refolding chaperone
MKRPLLAVCLLLGVLLPSLPVLAAEDDGDPFDGRLLPVELVMAFRRDIALTREQSQTIGELVVELQRSVAEKQWQMQSAYFDLLEVLDAQRIDRDRALALTEAAVDLENEIKLAQVALLIDVRNLLTPEQIRFLRARQQAGWEKGQ